MKLRSLHLLLLLNGLWLLFRPLTIHAQDPAAPGAGPGPSLNPAPGNSSATAPALPQAEAPPLGDAPARASAFAPRKPSTPAEEEGPPLNPKFADVSTARLYSTLQQRSRKILAAPPEVLGWMQLPEFSGAASATKLRLERGLHFPRLASVDSVYDDALKATPAPVKPRSTPMLVASTSPAATPAPETAAAEMESVDSEILADELIARSFQHRKSIYGTAGDQREDIYKAMQDRDAAIGVGDPAPPEKTYLQAADAVGFIVDQSVLRALPSGDYYILADPLGPTNKLCQTESFWNQPSVIGIGSGFLVTASRLYTAGHCLPDGVDVSRLRIIFDYKLLSDAVPRTIAIHKEDVYSIKKVVKHDTTEDWAILDLDRATKRTPVSLGTGKPAVGDAVFTIGYPSGLPLKISPNGHVVTVVGKSHYFLAAVDAFGGNSGGPVISLSTGKVEGILVGGNDDVRLIDSGKCFRNVVITDTHKGEAICSISVVSAK